MIRLLLVYDANAGIAAGLLSAAKLDLLPDLDALIAALEARLTPPPPAPRARSARA